MAAAGRGLRISEAFGLLVGGLILDGKQHGYLVVDQEGGQFQIRDDAGTRQRVRRKKTLKTGAAYRVVALADPLTRLLLAIIAVYHTAEDGTIDLSARLVPVIRAEEGGAASFRAALSAAARSLKLAPDNPDDYSVTPHGLRKAFNTDLARDHDLPRVVRLRTMGHRAGSSVNDLVHTLDRRLRKDVRPAAKSLEKQLGAATATLMIPTAIRAGYGGAQVQRVRTLYVPRLCELGWQVDPRAGHIGVAEAAGHLGLAESTTRGLMAAGTLPAVKDARGRSTTLSAVLDYRAAYLEGRRRLGDVARDCAATYPLVYGLVQRLGLAREKDKAGDFLRGEDDVAVITGECARLAALDVRAVAIGQAAALLGTRHKTSVHDFVAQGRPCYDAERDGGGDRRITRPPARAEHRGSKGGERPRRAGHQGAR